MKVRTALAASHRAVAVHLLLEVSMALLQLQVFTQQALVAGALLQQLLLQLPPGLQSRLALCNNKHKTFLMVTKISLNYVTFIRILEFKM